MNKDTLLNALNDYLLHIQLDPIGDITSKINAVEACRNYVAAIDGDVVNADWVKSNCIIILPAIDYQRKALMMLKSLMTKKLFLKQGLNIGIYNHSLIY